MSRVLEAWKPFFQKLSTAANNSLRIEALSTRRWNRSGSVDSVERPIVGGSKERVLDAASLRLDVMKFLEGLVAGHSLSYHKLQRPAVWRHTVSECAVD